MFNAGLQMLCGLRHWMYWLTAFLWDYFVFLIPASLCMVVFVAVGLKVSQIYFC